MKTTSINHGIYREPLRRRLLALAMVVILTLVLPSDAAPLGTAFTFQGKLYDRGGPAEGIFEFEMTLYNAESGGTPVAGSLTLEEVAVSEGIFTVSLDFGVAAFDGEARWLEISVRDDNPGANGTHTILEPRTRIAPSPYALMAAEIRDGAITAAKLADGAVGGAKIAAGSIGATQLADGGVEARHILAGAVGHEQLAAGAVDSSKIADGSITTSDLAAGAVDSSRLAADSAMNNLLASGQAPVGAGGVILSEQPNAAQLLAGGYIKLGAEAVELSPEKWSLLPVPPILPGGSVGGRRTLHTMVWTGTELILWGGYSYDANQAVNTGLRYQPATGTWAVMSTTGAPEARSRHSAVWTGTEMIVWGGFTGSSVSTSGGRYNPATDTWTALNAAGAPSGRQFHQAFWTGTQMIVWGGLDGAWLPLNTGARYVPATDSWAPISLSGAPTARVGASVLWAGNQMLVWGGRTPGSELYSTSFGDGARYSPANNTWSSITTNNAPLSRHDHAAVWTGSEMIVQGGFHNVYLEPEPGCVPSPFYDCTPYVTSTGLSGGARYNPLNNTWTALSAPPAGTPLRSLAQAVWSGDEMIVWGGVEWEYDCQFLGCGLASVNSARGLRYRPSNDSWSGLSVDNGPEVRPDAIATWCGTEMIIWGGDYNVGRRYHPSTDTWSPTASSPGGDTPERSEFSSVWTGQDWIIWGGQNPDGALLRSGLRFDPESQTWSILNMTDAPAPRKGHTAVWTGNEMIVWGGLTSSGTTNTGGRYDPLTDTWSALSVTNAPLGRRNHTATWTGQEMVVWGGTIGITVTATGGRYDPATDTWTTISSVDAPSPRGGHTAVWSGEDVIIWGGGALAPYANTGARYRPATDTWIPMPTSIHAPGRLGHGAVWTGSEMLIWGGQDWGTNYNSGALFNPKENSWSPIPAYGQGRTQFTGVWAHNKYIVWGGRSQAGTLLPYGGVYDVASNQWAGMNQFPLTPSPRRGHAAIWTGQQMLVWGGQDDTQWLADGRAYSPSRKFYLYMKP